MFYLISGGSGSGKSAYAEQIAVELQDRLSPKAFLYIATMMAFDQETEEKIQRHRSMRKDKGFTTLECFTNLGQAVLPESCTVLLDCLSNLVANEMFSDKGAKEQTVESVLQGIVHVLEHCENLIIVSNEIFSDGCDYDETTKQYIKNLGYLNQKLAAMADKVVEVVCGIPLYYKG